MIVGFYVPTTSSNDVTVEDIEFIFECFDFVAQCYQK